MKVQVSEHHCVSPRTGKRGKDTLSTSVRAHKFNCNHTVAWEYFSIIGRESTTTYWKQMKAFSLNETPQP